MKQLKIHPDYTTFGRTYQLKICSETDILIPSDDKVRLLSEVMEGLDYTQLYRAYSPKGRKPATPPVTMFKILVYANTERNYSSRDISSACKRDINYMWLLGDEKAPNHSEIARFRSKRLPLAAEDLFYQLVTKLGEIGEIKYEHLFVDGTKIEANANKYTFVWQKSTNKYQERLSKNTEEFMIELNKRYKLSFTQETPLSDILKHLESLKTTPFVYGRGKRKTQLQRDVEQLLNFTGRQAKFTQR